MSGSNRSGRVMVLTLLTLAILAVLGGGYYLSGPRDHVAELRAEIDRSILSGNRHQAVELLRQLVELQPENYAVHKVLADTLRDIARETNPNAVDPPEAVKHLVEAVRLNPQNARLVRRLYDDFRRLDQDENASAMAMQLVKLGDADTDLVAQAIRHALATGDKEFIDNQSGGLSGETLQADILHLGVEIDRQRGVADKKTYWKAERLVTRLTQTASIRLQALDKFYFRYVGVILEATVRHAPSGAEADRRLLQAFSIVSRLALGESGRKDRIEVVEMAARPIAAALRSRVREGLDLTVSRDERSDLPARRRALQQFVDLAEPIFHMGAASPFVYEQLSRAALELENDELAISLLQRGFQLHEKMPDARQNELMSVHAQSAVRLISRGQFAPLREDVAILLRHKHTAELGQLMNGLLAFQQGRFKDAHDSLAAIPQDSPHSVAASGLLVRVLLTQDRWEEALALIETVDDLWPTLPEVTRHWLAEAAGSRDRLKLLKVCCMLRLGQIRPAIEVLSYLDESPLRAKSKLIRLIELMRSGRETRCWEVLREARTEEPHDFDLMLGEFGMLLRSDATEGAARVLATFVQQHPDQPRAGIAYVDWLRKQGESAAALAALQKVRTTTPESVLVWLLSADLLMTMQRADEVEALIAEMQHYETAVAYIPVVHAYSVLRNDGLDEAAGAMLDSSFEAHFSNGYTTTEAMAALAKGNGELAYRQFAGAFNVSSVAARDRERLLIQIGEAFLNVDAAVIGSHIDQMLLDLPAEPSLLIAGFELSLRRGALELAAQRVDALEAVDTVPGRCSFLRARMYAASGVSAKALDEVRKTLQEAPAHGPARLMAARLEYADGEFAQTLEHLRQVPFPLSESEEAALLLGRTLARLGRSEEALITLTERVRQAPGRVAPWLALSQAYASVQRTDDAQLVLEQAIRFHPTDHRIQTSLLDMHLESGDIETAEALAQTFGGESPDLFDSMRFARIFLDSGEPEVAYQWIVRAHMVPNAEDNDELVYLDAMLLHERGIRGQRWELLQAARRRYETVLKRQPGHIEALNGLARLLMRDFKTTAEGVAIVEQIRTAMPLERLDPEVQATVSEAYRRAGRAEEALTILRRSIHQNPDAAVLRLELAAALLASSPEDPVTARQAKAELEKAAELRLPANRLSEFHELNAQLENS